MGTCRLCSRVPRSCPSTDAGRAQSCWVALLSLPPPCPVLGERARCGPGTGLRPPGRRALTGELLQGRCVQPCLCAKGMTWNSTGLDLEVSACPGPPWHTCVFHARPTRGIQGS